MGVWFENLDLVTVLEQATYEVEKEEYDKDVEAGKIISLRTEISEQMKFIGDLKVMLYFAIGLIFISD